MKWRKLIKFIREHRKAGFGSFQLLTTSDRIIIITINKYPNNDRLEIPY